MEPGQLYERQCQERMQMVVVDDFAALNDSESRFGLGRSPPAGIRGPHRNGIAVLAARKGISLHRSDTDFPVLGQIQRFVRRRRLSNIARTISG